MQKTTLDILATKADVNYVNGIITDADLPVPEDTRKAMSLAARLSGLSSQRTVAAFAVNVTAGTITGAEMTEVLSNECDGKVSDRHGPHYLSHARTGKLSGIREDITIESKLRTAKPFETLDAATKAFDKVLSRVPADERAAFIKATRAALSASTKKA